MLTIFMSLVRFFFLLGQEIALQLNTYLPYMYEALDLIHIQTHTIFLKFVCDFMYIVYICYIGDIFRLYQHYIAHLSYPELHFIGSV